MGTNDSVSKVSGTVLDDLCKLKCFVEQKTPGICIILPGLINRTDNGKVKLTRVLVLVKKNSKYKLLMQCKYRGNLSRRQAVTFESKYYISDTGALAVTVY